MDLYLLRHADANTDAASDDARQLSDKGVGQAKKVGRFCKEHGIEPELILTSPVRRARETAQIVSEQVNGELLIAPWIACGMHPETACEELRAYSKFDRVMLVGHQPDLSLLIAHLIGLPDPEQLRVRKASLTYLEVAALAPSAACLHWVVPCRLM